MSTSLFWVRKTTSSVAPTAASSEQDKKVPMAMSESESDRSSSRDSSLEKKEQPSSLGITTELHLIKTSHLDRDVVLKRIRHHKFRRTWLNHRTTTLSGLDPDDAFSAP